MKMSNARNRLWRQEGWLGIVIMTGHGDYDIVIMMWWKWYEWGVRSPLCTYRLNRARITSWWWWDKWDVAALRHRILNSRPGGLRRVRYLSVTKAPNNMKYLRVSGETFCFFETRKPEPFQAGSFNHCTRAPPYLWHGDYDWAQCFPF